MTQETCSSCKKQRNVNMFDIDNEGKRHNQCKYCRIDTRSYVCIKCEQTTPYNKMSFNRGNLQKKCLKCCKAEAKARYTKNRVARIAKSTEYVKANPEKVGAYQKRYKRKHRVSIAAYQKRYRQINVDRLKAYRREYRTRPHAKMRETLHGRLRKVLKANNVAKTKRTIPLLGCSIQTFLKWMKFQFDPYMTWKNHGPYWHIDHCRPCESFDVLKLSEQKICFHWTNLQPMEGVENLRKGSNYTSWDLFKQELKVKAFEFLLRNS